MTGHPPTEAEIAAVRERALSADAVVVGTINATRDPAQVRLVAALMETRRPVIVVALRTPFDLAAIPTASPYLATYSLLPDSLVAMAEILVGKIAPAGRLPVPLADLYPRGHGIVGPAGQAA